MRPTRLLRTLALIAATTLVLPIAAASAKSPTPVTCVNGLCPEKAPPITYGGGPLVTKPNFFLVRFSDSPTTLSPATGFLPQTFAPTAPNMATALIAASYEYAQELTQYNTPNQILQTGTYSGTYTIYDPTLADATTIDDSQIQAALRTAVQSGVLPHQSTNDVYTVVTRDHQIITLGNLTSGFGFCGYHSYAYPPGGMDFTYIVAPNDSDSPYQLNSTCLEGPDGSYSPQLTFDNYTGIISHEVAEVMTDGYLTGWRSPFGGYNEIGDLCTLSSDPENANSGPMPYDGYNYWIAYVYSNIDNACVNGPVPTSIVTDAGPFTTNVTGTLETYGNLASITYDPGIPTLIAPAPNQTITVSNGATVLGTTTTDAAGHFSFPLTSVPAGDVLTLSYSGDSVLEPTTTLVRTQAVWSLAAGQSISGPLGLYSPSGAWSLHVTPQGLTLTGPAQFTALVTVRGATNLTLTSRGTLQLLGPAGQLWKQLSRRGTTLTLSNTGHLVLAKGARVIWTR